MVCHRDADDGRLDTAGDRHGPHLADRGTEPVRAWLRRPDRLRVETLDGRLLQLVDEPRTQVALFGPDGSRTVTYPWPADGPAPVWRPDGLAAVRPERLSYDAPMYQSYDWVAMLDPVELADGRDPDTGEDAGSPGLEVDAVTEVEHGGRPAWEAHVRTTPRYEPRCGCCPLLRSPEVDAREYGQARGPYPRVQRIRLDVQTGVCVLADAPETLGTGHDLRIEAVDEPMAGALFGS
ncbi:hypothetical protein E4P41_04150 [Geodermatophilus sp. DF01-2]|uniref:hypothetical protein n=1 Tax=Geodermatophilus sp. DF01-2 TaxID=2559610 RepID=UPI001073BD12|nr:hypothetical protein [Geodermatophilus sp. DF01_2]TFV63674.1 hypothetical protein E4P41_04150 [Geodermatophilus sp. DF01_2]